MLMAAMLAMMLAAAAPAFAQGSVNVVNCNQIQAALGQYQNAAAANYAITAQKLGVSQNQVLACFQNIAAGRPASAAASVQYATASPTATATASATATATASASASALPPTGGASPSSAIALGAGGLLVAGGLLARRIVR